MAESFLKNNQNKRELNKYVFEIAPNSPAWSDYDCNI